VAQAQVYKCPGKVQGQFVYQQQACKGAKPEQYTVKIVPFDQQKIDEAQKKLADDVEARKEKETIPAAALPTTGENPAAKPASGTAPAAPPPAPVIPTEPAKNNGETLH
jgi:hypothetical protein